MDNKKEKHGSRDAPRGVGDSKIGLNHEWRAMYESKEQHVLCGEFS